MYSIYQIYQSDKLVYSTYHTINPDFIDTTKLDLLINSPITPYTLVDSYFKQPDTFSIQTIKSGIDNALEASEALKSYLIEANNRAIDNTIGTRKPRVKKLKKDLL
ncbi:hypothetical protein FW754_15325 [Acinetobacter sp. 1207_04]|uniref:hypothetical protein n=1 Tax=Acinetobacter sp. 1207_04 TaxID=2604449 RepID=UPI004059F61C